MLGVLPAILDVAEVTLSLLKEREKNYPMKTAEKYAVQLHKLKEEFYEEYNRDPKVRSDAILDDVQLRLRLFITDFAAFLRAENVQNK